MHQPPHMHSCGSSGEGGSINQTAGGMGGGLAIAGGALLGPLAWTFVGVVFIAETGINYRRFKRGEISKKELKTRIK